MNTLVSDKGIWNFTYNIRKWKNEYDLAFDLLDVICKGKQQSRFYEDFNEKENLLMLTGISNIWECLIGNGTGTAAQNLTYFNNGNAFIGVGDSSTAEVNTQTDLQAATNKVRVGMDATFPLHYDGTATKTITGATNATPIVITATSHGYTTGDGAVITAVGGNTNANGTWIIDVVDANSFSLRGSAGNSAYTSGGVATRNSVIVFRSTFGSATANFVWAEFGIFNASSAGRMLNRKVAAQGTKASPAIWQFTSAVSLA